MAEKFKIKMTRNYSFNKTIIQKLAKYIANIVTN